MSPGDIVSLLWFAARVVAALLFVAAGFKGVWRMLGPRAARAPRERRVAPRRKDLRAARDLALKCATSSISRSLMAERLRALARGLLALDGVPDDDTFSALRAGKAGYDADATDLMMSDHLLARSRKGAEGAMYEDAFQDRVERTLEVMHMKIHGKRG